MKQTDEKIIKISDRIFIVGLVMLIAAHFITVLAIAMISDHGSSVADVARAYERNPLATGLIETFSSYNFMIAFIILPGFSAASYWLIRHYYRPVPSFILFNALFVFFSALLNVTNDMAALTGLMLQYGMI